VLVKDGGVLHDYRVDRGVIRAKSPGMLSLLERDGSVVSIAVAPTASDHARRPADLRSPRCGADGRDRHQGRRQPGHEVRATTR
jgi:hypothetical protein